MPSASSDARRVRGSEGEWSEEEGELREETRGNDILARSEGDAGPIEVGAKVDVFSEEPGSASIEDGAQPNEEMRRLLRTPRYFDPPEDSAIRCFKCGGSGHLAKHCMEQEKKKPCFLCGKYGHQKSDCPNFLCFRCFQPGHQSRDCPVSVRDLQKLRLCLRCGRSKCSDPCDVEYLQQDLMQITCPACQEKGHLCCVDNLGYLPKRSCLACGEKGHTVNNCSKSGSMPRADRMKETKIICYNCSEAGHMARDCPFLGT